MKTSILLLISIIILLSIIIYKKIYLEKFVPEYLNHKTKSFADEKYFIDKYGVDGAWKGQPTRSFDSENQGQYMNGLYGGFIGKTI